MHITAERTCKFPHIYLNFNIRILTPSFVLEMLPKKRSRIVEACPIIITALQKVLTFFLCEVCRDFDKEEQQSRLPVWFSHVMSIKSKTIQWESLLDWTASSFSSFRCVLMSGDL